MKSVSTNKAALSCPPPLLASEDAGAGNLPKGGQNGRVNKCRKIRDSLRTAIRSHFGLKANWIQNHIASCPRCQRRFASIGKVNLALSLVKSQSHKLDLLMRANTQAIGVLKHSLREAPKAQKIKIMQSEPKLLEKCSVYKHSAANIAACITILLLVKIGVFSSMDKFQTHGQKVVRQYYVNHVGEDLTNDLFPS